MAENTVEVKFELIDSMSKDLKKIREELDKTTKSADAAKGKKGGGGFSGLVDAIEGISPISLTAAGGLLAVGAALKYSISEFSGAEKASKQLDSVLKSTNNAAGMTRKSLDELAASLSRVTAVDDDAITQAEALMLTFTNIGADIFPAATEAALDMSRALGQDLQASVMQLGKALNAPVEGVAALQRVGVKLTDSQKLQVEYFMAINDKASAQKIILAELRTEFGNSAKAYAETFAGSWDAMKISAGNLAQTLGEKLAPALKKIIDANREAFEFYSGGGKIKDMQQLQDVAVKYHEIAAEIKSKKTALGYNVSAELKAKLSDEIAQLERQAKTQLAIHTFLQNKMNGVSNNSPSTTAPTSGKSDAEMQAIIDAANKDEEKKEREKKAQDAKDESNQRFREVVAEGNRILKARKDAKEQQKKIAEDESAFQKTQHAEWVQRQLEAIRLEDYRAEVERQYALSRIESGSELIGSLARVNGAMRGSVKLTQGLMLAQAGMNVYSGISAIWGNPNPLVTFPQRLIESGIVGANAIAQVVGISKQKFARGALEGPVKGPKSGDKVPIMANGGEGVFTEEQQARLFRMATGKERGGGFTVNVTAGNEIDTKTIVKTLDNLARDGYFNNSYYLKQAMAGA